MPRRIRFQSGKATLELIQTDPGIFALSSLYSMNRGRGEAKDVMRSATEYADLVGARLRLIVKGFDAAPEALTDEQLVLFYRKFGFEIDPGQIRPPYLMSRQPTYGKKNHHA